MNIIHNFQVHFTIDHTKFPTFITSHHYPKKCIIHVSIIIDDYRRNTEYFKEYFSRVNDFYNNTKRQALKKVFVFHFKHIIVSVINNGKFKLFLIQIFIIHDIALQKVIYH